MTTSRLTERRTGLLSSRPKIPTPGHSKVAQHSVLLSVSAAVVGVLSYGCSFLMANALGPTDYSHFAAGQMLLGIVGIVASALVPLPLSHIVATHAEGSEARRDALAFAVMISVISGLVVAMIAGAVAAAFASPSMGAAVALSALALFLVAAPSGWLQGELRFMRYTVTAVGEVAVRLLFSVLAVALLWGSTGAVLGFVVGAVVLFAVPLSFYRDITWRPRVMRERWRWAETADIALTLCIVSVLVGADVVVIAFLDGGSIAAAGFQALATIAKGPVYVAAGTVLVAFPLLRSRGVEVNDVLSAALRSFGQLVLVAFAVIATAPHGLVALVLPDQYRGSLDLLPWLAAAGLGYATVTVLATVLLALRAYRRCQVGLAVACLLILGGISAGWQLHGVAGLAIGCAIGSLLSAIALAAISYHLLPAGTGQAASRGLFATGALTLLLALVGMLPLAWLVAVCGVGVAVLAHQRGHGAGRWNKPGEMLRRLAISLASLVNPASWASVLARPATLLPFRSGSSQGAYSSYATEASVDRMKGEEGGRSLSAPPLEVAARHRRTGRVLLPPLGTATLTAAFLAISGAALGVRAFGLHGSFELWVDEVIYAQLGQSTEGAQLPHLPDGPFFLHPPGFFFLEGLVINSFGISGSILDIVMDLRWVNAVIGAVTVGLAFLLVRKVANRAAGWFAAALLIFEPFVLRNNSHVFLETLGMAAVVGGLLILVLQLKHRAVRASVSRLVFAGLLMGYGVLTKDVFAICTVGPVVIAVLWRRTLQVRDALVLVGTSALPYGIYLSIVAAQGMLPDWVWAKFNGAQRMIGLEKSTGFTAEGSPSLGTRLIDQMGHFGTSYLLLALCPLAAGLICFSHRPERRLIGLVGLALGGFGVYSAVFGTFEEQYGYGVMIGGVLSIAVLAAEVVERRPWFRLHMASMGVTLMLFTVVLGLRTEITTDDGYVQVRQWVQHNLPADAKVSVTNSTGQLAFADDQRFGVWPSAPLMAQNDARYILTQSLPTSQGYGYAQPKMLAWLSANATPVFTVQGPTNGSTTLWHVGDRQLAAAAASGVGTPSKTYETER